MDPSPLVLGIYRSADPTSAFRSIADGLASVLPLRCAFRLDGLLLRDRWPHDAELSQELIDTAAHVLRPEVFPLGSEFPFDAARYDAADFLVLPLHSSAETRSVCVLIADRDSFGEDLQPWEEVAAALQDNEARHRRVLEAEERCAELKRRVEESESLHTLGLAANRTLNKDEVLNLVARFTRTLLGAHYVTVNTVTDGKIGAAAWVGLRNAEAAPNDYRIARAVLEAERPLIVGGAAQDLRVESFPFHQAEGMRSGLGIPLTLFGDTFGALVVGYRREYQLTPRDIRLALTLAAHAAVAISNARLHAAVEQRSRELARAYEQLNALTAAKERFFASINHELRNPLGAILGYHALILEDGNALPDGSRQWLEKANRAAVTLRDLVNDILDLSKLAAGKLEVEPSPCTVREILDGALNTIQPLADERGVPLRLEIAPDLPTVHTDASRLQQIVVNLLSNAIKFTSEAGVRVLAEMDLGGAGAVAEHIVIRVVDSGPGIAPEDLDRIFEEYEQVRGTRGGTGLGLPISRRLARALGGDITVQSQPGAGSTFLLTIPLNAAQIPTSGLV